ncbi:dihydroxyacetone kinase family protein [Henriciella pelagia]|uniref:dihydroxyacetone kinase family protein n=1 Tax=Henriciella pelagia TaxID=1977912 RepID=UPI0035154AEA
MRRLHNDPVDFADEMIDGFVAANSAQVRRVSGGVIRNTASNPDAVALVIGGGSGHYPAFGGLVGQGLAHGAAMGNIFASPPAQHVHSVASRAALGGGVLLVYGNYAGDVLNFDQAQKQLISEGIDCRSVVVTDDVASAPITEKHKRRGIAGDLCVFKVAAAASDAGYSLDEVVRVAALANERTRSFGVAFTGCTLPGADAPLFTIPEGRMGVGVGIHGEPGIDETDVPSADGLASLLVEKLLADLPEGVAHAKGARASAILNGLGAVKYEELFVVYRRVAQLLGEVGVTVIEPEVGELVTSFDMGGVSLTLFWLDEELEKFWGAPADSPAYRKGSIGAVQTLPETLAAKEVTAVIAPSTPESRAAAAIALQALNAISTVVNENVQELGRIDAVAGDGDHGIGMQRGATAALGAAKNALAAEAGAQSLLEIAADSWAERAGGTSGALWRVALRAVAASLGNTEQPRSCDVVAGVLAARDGILTFGATVGDKTMIDALVPFAETLEQRVGAGSSLAEAWAEAAEVTAAAAAATADMLPKVGRARPHAENSLGTPDAGAHSLALIVQCISAVLAGE